MIDVAAIRAEFTDLIERFKEDAHNLLTRITGQAAADAHSIEQQASDDIHTAEADVHQALTAEQPPTTPTQ